jgi:hypothetical protein
MTILHPGTWSHDPADAESVPPGAPAQALLILDGLPFSWYNHRGLMGEPSLGSETPWFVVCYLEELPDSQFCFPRLSAEG